MKKINVLEEANLESLFQGADGAFIVTDSLHEMRHHEQDIGLKLINAGTIVVKIMCK